MLQWKVTGQRHQKQQRGEQREKKVVRQLCRQAEAVIRDGLLGRAYDELSPGEVAAEVHKHDMLLVTRGAKR